MPKRFPIILLVAVLPVHAGQWEQLPATTASLRSAGAHVVSSDAIGLEKSRTALITYWESSRGSSDIDVYRCVDVVDENFEPISQSCWKVLTADGRRPIEVD